MKMLSSNNFWVCIAQLFCTVLTQALTITSGHCQKNISVKYHLPVTKTRLNLYNSNNELLSYTETYVDFEERIRWETVQICCPGYRTIIFGLCEPICVDACPKHSYCAEPNKCACERGYEPSHHPNKLHQLMCRPVCHGGCPDHSRCVARNECECRPGFKDISSWFSPMRCERIPCAPDQRYDVGRRMCVKNEMTMEELMRRVGEKLARGLDGTDPTDSDEFPDEDD